MARRHWLLALAALPAVAFAQGTVSGTVTYRERMALPSDARIVVSLDAFSPNGGQKNLSEVTFWSNGRQVPFAFSLPYFLGDPEPGATYGLRARIEVGGKLLFESPKHSVVKLDGKGRATLGLVRAQHGDLWPLEGVEWRVIEIEGQPLPFKDSPPTLEFDAGEGRINGFGGVNRFSAAYAWSRPGAQIDPGPMTLMAGPPERMKVENDLVRLLSLVNRLTIEEGQLMLWRGEKLLLRLDRART